MTRPLRIGDRVTATGTVQGINDEVSVLFDGALITNLFCSGDSRALTLVAPVEPPVGSVVVKGGVAWRRSGAVPDRWYDTAGVYSWNLWDSISDGEVIFTPGGAA